MIFEILDDGQRTRILASNRRQPPASVLDSEKLGTPALFEGPGLSAGGETPGDKICDWVCQDWRCSLQPPVSFPPAIFEEGVLFLTDGFNFPARISRLTTGTDLVEFCRGGKFRPGTAAVLRFSRRHKTIMESAVRFIPTASTLCHLAKPIYSSWLTIPKPKTSLMSSRI